MFKRQTHTTVFAYGFAGRVRRGSAFVATVFVAIVALLSSSLVWAEYTLDDGEGLKDPTAPAQYRPAPKVIKQAPKNFKLSYILDSEARRYAIVNGKKLSVGDRIEGARLLDIQSRSVVLLVNGRRQTIQMNAVTGIKKKN